MQCTFGKNNADSQLDDGDVESAVAMRKMFPEIFKDQTYQELSVIKWGRGIDTNY